MHGETHPGSRDPSPAEPAITELARPEPPDTEAIPFARPVAGVYLPKVPVAPAHDFLLLGESRKEVWLDLGCFMVLLMAFEVCVGPVFALMTQTTFRPANLPIGPVEAELSRIMLLPALSMRGLGVIIIAALIARHRGQRAPSLGAASSGWAVDALIGVGATVVIFLLAVMVMLLLRLLWPALSASMADNAERLMGLVPRLRLIHFVPVAIMVGLYEELLFRGFLMGRLRRATGSWTVAVILSSIVFTALHALDQTVGALVLVAILSLVFSLVTIWRRSIVPAVVAHALFNFCQFWILTSTAGQSWT